jgi:hypothetical protein
MSSAMAWWNETPTEMPPEARALAEQRLREGATLNDMKIELRNLGWHGEADGKANPNADRVYRSLRELKRELVNADQHDSDPPSGSESQLLRSNQIGAILAAEIPRGRWIAVALGDIYDIVEANAALTD